MNEMFLSVVPMGATTHQEILLHHELLEFGCRDNENWDRDLQALSPYEYWLSTPAGQEHVKQTILSLAARLGVRVKVRVIVVGDYAWGESPSA